MSSSDVSDAEENSICGVEGFQFEPLRKDFEVSWETVEEYDDEDSEPDLNRLYISIDNWYPCKIEEECVCCHDLETAHTFDLKAHAFFYSRA